MSGREIHQIALIGLGTIGMSMTTVHLRDPKSKVHLFDTRPDLEQHVLSQLPPILEETFPGTCVTSLISAGRIKIHKTLEEACRTATIVQEQGPENLAFKRGVWAEVERTAPPSAHFWSSTSGIPVSEQSADMQDKTRLLVVHPFNPPHIMPLIEIVPAPNTAAAEVEFVMAYFREVSPSHQPVVVNKEIPGFVGNRLAFAVLREACHLVQENVVSVQDLDKIMMASLGPRWAVNGLFESYNAGGGESGFGGFVNKLEDTIQAVWEDLGTLKVEGDKSGWKDKVVVQTAETYGQRTLEQTVSKQAKLRRVLAVQEDQL
jgi:3-hydroxyacyl-CoA dehydrogenase